MSLALSKLRATPLSPIRGLRMTPEELYARVLACDASYNGRFLLGVLTTGTYCLPSCRAKKPKLENVRFYASCESAREAGFRACLKCHPDDFARGADPVLEAIEKLAAEMWSEPAKFPNVRAVVRRSGFGATRLFELFRLHYHLAPADFLLRARLRLVKQALLDTETPITEIALGAGFDALSTFHENFRREEGMTPAKFRRVKEESGFKIELPAGYSLPYLRRALGRDPHSVNERLVGDHYEAAVTLDGEPAMLALELAKKFISARVDWLSEAPGRRQRIARGAAAHALVTRILGLAQPALAFARLARKLGLARLVADRPGLRVSQTHSVFDGLLWAIIGQQINFPFAALLKSRLFKLAGAPAGNGLHHPPTPAAVAALEPAELVGLQFSRQKADYVIGTARLVVEGKLGLETLRELSATRAERTLLAIRGLGPWSVNYVMMRALGFADCVPLGDTGVTSGLQALFELEERPDVDGTRRLMGAFTPYRSLATAHLWQFTKTTPP